jgi:hypothetical protein
MYAELNNNYNLEGINTFENFSNYVSSSYSQEEQNAFSFFGISITDGNIVDANKFDASISSAEFMTNYNIVMKTEGNNANSNVIQQLKSLKDRRDQNKSNTISVLEARYNNLTAALKQYETDEKQVWQNLNTAKDTNFMKKRESYLIQQKLNRLKNERNMVFNDLTNEYNNLTKYKSNLLKLSDRDDYVKDFQNNMNHNNRKKLDSIDQDLITRRRQAQIDMDQYYRQNNTIYYLKILFVFTLLALIPIILGISGIGFKKSTASIASGVIFIIAGLIMIMRYVDNRNRSDLLWQERDFKADFDVSDAENNSDSCNNDNRSYVGAVAEHPDSGNTITGKTKNGNGNSTSDIEDGVKKNVKAFW